MITERCFDGDRCCQRCIVFCQKIKHGRLELKRNFFSQRVIVNWNRIPADLKNIVTKERHIPRAVKEPQSKNDVNRYVKKTEC